MKFLVSKFNFMYQEQFQTKFFITTLQLLDEVISNSLRRYKDKQIQLKLAFEIHLRKQEVKYIILQTNNVLQKNFNSLIFIFIQHAAI